MVVSPAESWAADETADWWLKEDKCYAKNGDNKIAEDYLKSVIPKNIKSILEVGAGSGHLISMFKKYDAHSVDINRRLCENINKKYPIIKTHNCSADRIDLPDNSIDFVYTFQVLQHIPNDLIRQTLKELLRVTRDELLLMEGWMPNKEQGERTHKANGGSFCYYFDHILECESVEWVIPQKIVAYRIRKKFNSGIPDVPFGSFIT